ncbi:MAG: hypothetical protein KDA57_00685 [Planctomycetales bacterium]|nr:hypothetical protein [Planctomycetales bacterium]
MSYVVLGFGVLILMLGVVIVVKPEYLFDMFRKYADSFRFQVLAVLTRLALGGALLMAADESKFPIALQVIGGISILAAIVFALMSRVRFKRLLRWALGFAPSFTRIAGVVATLLGGFLVYAVA